MDLRSAIHACFRKAGAVAGNLVPGSQRQRLYRQGKLFPACRWLVDARQEEPGAAGLTIFQSTAEVTPRGIEGNLNRCQGRGDPAETAHHEARKPGRPAITA